MNKELLFKSLVVVILSCCYLNTFATVDWVGNMFPTSGSSTTITEGDNHTVYVQVYNAGVTEPAGQGGGIMCELYYGDVDAFGMTWNNIFTQAMTYNVDIGNNDEYQATITPNANLYELTCRCSSDGGANWTFASLSSGNAMLTVDALLPVDLTDFSASQESTFVELEWLTKTETDNKSFEVEKTNDLRAWERIAEVEGQGNSFIEKDYKFIDQNPFQGINYYRLKQVDFNGDYSYSNTVSVEFEKAEISVFPNPTNGIVNVSFNKNNVATAIEIFNLQGQLIHSASAVNENTQAISLEEFSNGVYFVRVIGDNGIQLSSKAVVKR